MPRKRDYRQAGEVPDRLRQLVIRHEIDELRKYAEHREPDNEKFAYDRPGPQYRPNERKNTPQG